MWDRLPGFFAPVFGPLGTLAVVFLLATFMLAQREDLRNRLIKLGGADDIQKTTAAIDDAATRVGRMLATQLALNTAFGAAIATGLWLIGVPGPFLWGVFAGLLRFIPYLGPLIGALPPMLVAFAFAPGWWQVAFAAALFFGAEMIVGNVLEPLLYGHSSGLSPLAILISTLVWAFLWGPVGVLLSTPLTICLVVLGRHVEGMSFIETILGNRPPLSPPELLYQRLLAGDPAEARLVAVDFLREHSLEAYLDTIALPAVRRAHLDIGSGAVAGPRLTTLVNASNRLLQALRTMRPGRRGFARPSAESFAAIEYYRPLNPGRRPEAPLPEAPGAVDVAVLHGGDPLDPLAADMLDLSLRRRGVGARVVPLDDAAGAREADGAAPRVVALSFVEPLSTLHLRAASMAVHRRARQARLVLCIWREMTPDAAAEIQKAVRVDAVAFNVADAAQAILRRRDEAPAA
jgi:hypothetical protein